MKMHLLISAMATLALRALAIFGGIELGRMAWKGLGLP